MIVLAAAAAVLLAVGIAGRDLTRVRHLPLHHGWLVAVAATLQLLVIVVVAGAATWLVVAGHLASYVLAGWWLWLHRRVRGLPLIGLGGAANLAAIATNGGVMPITPAAAATAGMTAGEGFTNAAPTADAPLWFLGDVFAVPAGWPLANAFSVGDVLLVVGLAVLLVAATRPEPVRSPDGPGDQERAGAGVS